MIKDKSESRIAFESYVKVFQMLKNAKEHESNKYPLDHASRVEHDLNELEKAHLDLLKAELDMNLANEARESSENLARKVWWLNAALILLSFALVIAAFFELLQ